MIWDKGRQVIGQCLVSGCQSEKGYADECALGHRYLPTDLINPRSTLSGKKPEMRTVTNWYFKLENFHKPLTRWVEELGKATGSRKFVIQSIRGFLELPAIYVKHDQLHSLDALQGKLPEYTVIDAANKTSAQLVFANLADREKAQALLSENGVRFRTGKTLVPFRLTGNVECGVSASCIEGLEYLTIWVWPESLWAPISFTMTYLEMNNQARDAWKQWWCSGDAKVYQFIGEDNVYFYGPAEMAMFMGEQGQDPSISPPEGELQLPELIVNNHLLFLNQKASSSGKIKPPTARDLLKHYTAEQLRAHFLGLGLGIRSVGFQPKPLNPTVSAKDSDPVLKEGNLLAKDNALRLQILADAFHMIRTATALMHPIAPMGTEMIREYLNLGEDFWNWEWIFEPVYFFMNDPQEHRLKFLEPRVDFFKKHSNQIKTENI